MKRTFSNLKKLVILSTAGFLVGCANGNTDEQTEEVPDDQDETMEGNQMTDSVKFSIDYNETYQTMESFGASGAWWSQDVGGWTAEEDGTPKRDHIARLLFDETEGIGLSSYRYNLGAGSTPENSPEISDPWRRAENFETSPGVYDWSKDANAQWMLNAAVNHGLEDIYLFVNSPLTRLTKNGAAYGEMIDGQSSNLASENYEPFAEYVYDVTEHFLNEGIPVTHISPVNEPQWEWVGGQEGNHVEPDEMIELLHVFMDKKDERERLQDVDLSMPELGEWGNSSYPYFDQIIEDERMMSYFDTWEVHSYWTSAFAKEDFKSWYNANDLDVELKMTEWTEMVNGRDYTMDSAMNLANQIYEDLTILDVTVWQYWIAVSSYDYRDGLIYVETDSQEISIPKRLWAMGNFSRFIRPGYTRITSEIEDNDINQMSFSGTNQDGMDELVSVFINNSTEEKIIDLSEIEAEELTAYSTDETSDLEGSPLTETYLTVKPLSIVTLVGTR